MIVQKGSTDVSAFVVLLDTDGVEASPAATALTIGYARLGSAWVGNTGIAMGAVTDAHADNEVILVNASTPGLHRVDFPNAAFATGTNKAVLTVTGTGLQPTYLQVDLVDYDPEDAVRLGLTALPNVTAGGAGGIGDAVRIAGDAGAATLLKHSAAAGVFGTATGTPTTTTMATSLTEATDDHYNDRVCFFLGGTLGGQARAISDYDGTTKTLTFAIATTDAAVATQEFVIL